MSEVMEYGPSFHIVNPSVLCAAPMEDFQMGMSVAHCHYCGEESGYHHFACPCATEHRRLARLRADIIRRTRRIEFIPEV